MTCQPEEAPTLAAVRDRAEREAIEAALAVTDTVTAAAERLGVSRAGLWKAMQRLGIPGGQCSTD